MHYFRFVISSVLVGIATVSIAGKRESEPLLILKNPPKIYGTSFQNEGKIFTKPPVESSRLDHGTVRSKLVLKGQCSVQPKFLSDNKFVVTGLRGGTLMISDVNSGNVARIFKNHSDEISQFEVSEDGERVVVAFLDGHIDSWNIPENKLIRSIPSLKDQEPKHIQIPRGAQAIVRVNQSGVLEVYDARDDSKPFQLKDGKQDSPTIYEIAAISDDCSQVTAIGRSLQGVNLPHLTVFDIRRRKLIKSRVGDLFGSFASESSWQPPLNPHFTLLEYAADRSSVLAHFIDHEGELVSALLDLNQVREGLLTPVSYKSLPFHIGMVEPASLFTATSGGSDRPGRIKYIGVLKAQKFFPNEAFLWKFSGEWSKVKFPNVVGSSYRSAYLSADGVLAMTLEMNGKAKLWTIHELEPHIRQEFDGKFRFISASPNHKKLALVSEHGETEIFETENLPQFQETIGERIINGLRHFDLR